MLNDKTLQEQIAELLTNHPHLREDDMKILANIWTRQLKAYMKQKNLPDISSGDIMAMIADGKSLSHFEAVRRTRQKLQEKYPQLRGPNYGKRKDKKKKMRPALEKFEQTSQMR